MNALSITASPIWHALGWTMIHLLWLGGGIGLAAALARGFSRSARPERRYGLALGFLAAMAAAPVVVFGVVLDRSNVEDASAPCTSPSPSSRPPAAPPARQPAAREPKLDTATPGVASLSSDRAWLGTLVERLPWLWLGGSAVTFGMLATGLFGCERLRRSSRLFEEGEVPRTCRRLMEDLGFVRRVSVGLCDRVATPVLMGILRPLILLPPTAFTGWTPEQLEMVLLHELAHLRRRDNTVNLVQRATEALLFFHPVVWWLSAWVRLEREHCCDRIAVEHLGERFPYAELLADLAGSGRGRRSQSVAVAMANRQVMTRICQILNFEDHSMRLTMPEGIGLAGALVLGTVLGVGSLAAPPPRDDKANTLLREALRTMASDVGTPKGEGSRHDLSGVTLLTLAQTQLKLGDRAAALSTLQRASESIEKLDPKKPDWEIIGAFIEISKAQRQVGDRGGARVTLDRLTRIVGAITPGTLDEELIQVTGTQEPRRRKHDVHALYLSMILTRVAEERTALGDDREAQGLATRAAEVIANQRGPLRSIGLSGIGLALFKAGMPEAARGLLDQAERAARELADIEEQNGAIAYLSSSLAEIGESDHALRLAASQPPLGQEAAFTMIVESLADDDGQGPLFDPGGIKINIGAEGLRLKGRADTRPRLAAISQAVRATGNPQLQAVISARVAQLQARAGDLAGAITTAGAMPNLNEHSHQGATSGFGQAIKPATLAILARVQVEAGNRPAARSVFERALSLSRVITVDCEKLVALLVIAREQTACEEESEARATLAELLPTALHQSEPLRSRTLAMIAEIQVNGHDTDRAAATVEAIRAYPGLEKNRAAGCLARALESAGEKPRAEAMRRMALDCLEAKSPGHPAMGEVRPLPPISKSTFLDPRFEYDPRIVDHMRETAAQSLRVQLGDIDGALQQALSAPPEHRAGALQTVISVLARQGNIARALAVVRSMPTADDRMVGLQGLASGIETPGELDAR